MLTRKAQARHPDKGRWASIGDDMAGLHQTYARTRDPRVREQLVERYAPLAEGLARRFGQRGESHEDLTQVALLGLLKAVDRFDPERGTRFSTFAVPTITGELKRHFRDHRWGTRVPRGIQENYLETRQANEDLTQELGRAPSVDEVAQRVGIGSDQVLEAMDAGRSFRPVSLDEPDGGSGGWAAGQLAEADPGFEAAEARHVVASLVRQLPEREQRVIRLRFSDEMTQSQIAEQIGVSQMQVCRVLARSLEAMRSLAAV